MRGRAVEWEALLNSDAVEPGKRMLYAMLSDQIQTLGLFRRLGMWRDDPSELGDWLREEYAKGRSNARNVYLQESAMMEWQMWGRGTEVLIEVMERETILRIDRARILELAKACADGVWSRGTTRTHLDGKKPKQKVA